MTNNNYVRGANLERAVKKYYESAGFKAVRAAGSHGESDIWATNGKVLYMVQCKIGADEKRGEKILEEMVDVITTTFPILTIPLAIFVVEGMSKGKPIILAKKVF